MSRSLRGLTVQTPFLQNSPLKNFFSAWSRFRWTFRSRWFSQS